MFWTTPSWRSSSFFCFFRLLLSEQAADSSETCSKNPLRWRSVGFSCQLVLVIDGTLEARLMPFFSAMRKCCTTCVKVGLEDSSMALATPDPLWSPETGCPNGSCTGLQAPGELASTVHVAIYRDNNETPCPILQVYRNNVEPHLQTTPRIFQHVQEQQGEASSRYRPSTGHHNNPTESFASRISKNKSRFNAERLDWTGTLLNLTSRHNPQSEVFQLSGWSPCLRVHLSTNVFGHWRPGDKSCGACGELPPVWRLAISSTLGGAVPRPLEIHVASNCLRATSPFQNEWATHSR